VAASKAAMNTLRGDFSRLVSDIAQDLAELRVRVEAAIDFPDEDIEILQEAKVAEGVAASTFALEKLLANAAQGSLISTGISVALIGEPNVGKSSLLNVLAGEEAAIVTNVPGTTRDLLKVDLVIGGLPIRLVDTAGLRDGRDEVEKIGVARAITQAAEADLTLYVVAADKMVEAHDAAQLFKEIGKINVRTNQSNEFSSSNILLVINKSDLTQNYKAPESINSVAVSAKTGDGIEQLKTAIQHSAGFDQDSVPFAARQRHVQILNDTLLKMGAAATALTARSGSELVAEELFLAHQRLGEITGILTPDDLLGKIFSEFCIGK
jgi:tRNA modification GTPase